MARFVLIEDPVFQITKVPKVIFLRWAHPSHDDYGETISDIEKLFFGFNCPLKKLNYDQFFCYLCV